MLPLGQAQNFERVLKAREIGRTSLLRNQWDRELNKVNISLQLNTLNFDTDKWVCDGIADFDAGFCGDRTRRGLPSSL